MEKLVEPPTEQDWAEHVERFGNFKGSMAKYCRQNNLSYESLRSRKIKREAGVAAKAAPAFVKVQSAPAEAKKSYPQLPDPEWLAVFIHKLMSRR